MTDGPDSTPTACVAAAGTVSASPATISVEDGSRAPTWLMISHRPVPVSTMSRTSCQAVCHHCMPLASGAVRAAASRLPARDKVTLRSELTQKKLSCEWKVPVVPVLTSVPQVPPHEAALSIG